MIIVLVAVALTVKFGLHEHHEARNDQSYLEAAQEDQKSAYVIRREWAVAEARSSSATMASAGLPGKEYGEDSADGDTVQVQRPRFFYGSGSLGVAKSPENSVKSRSSRNP